jgi:SAM-dependent methyltransferase
MDRDAFALMAAAERDHWWFRGRRALIAATLERLALPADARILDAGCGSGGNLALLAQFGTVWGFEYDADARAAAAALGIGTVAAGALPDPVPFSDIAFDAIGLFDVLEHLEKPVESLRALAARVSERGAIVLTVPALPWLWGPHDVHHQHFRRYTRSTLVAHLQAAGLTVDYVTYMNTLLLPLAVAQRVRERVAGYSTDDLMPAPWLNSMLRAVWSLERLWIPRHRAPIGLSLLAVARRATPAVA